MNRKIMLLAIAACFFAVAGFAQTPSILWDETYGGSAEDHCYFAQQTSDGGYILIGETRSFGAGSNDYWLIKTNANGNSLWSRTYGGSDYDRCSDGMITSDGGYILVGWSGPYSSRDFWTVKTDAAGGVQWNRRYGGYGGTNQEICSSVDQTSDGGYIMGGVCNNDIYIPTGEFWLVKTDASGNPLWNRAFGGSGRESCYSVRQTSDGGYILAGPTASYGAGDYDMWLLKTNSNGDSLWSKTFGGAGYEHCQEVRLTADGGFLLVGYSSSFGTGAWDGYLVKTDANGNEIWSRTYGGDSEDALYDACQTPDGGFMAVGGTQSYGAGNRDIWILRIDAGGDSLWSNTVGGTNREFGLSIRQNPDGSFIISGTTSSFGAGSYDYWLLKMEAEASGIGYVSLLSAGPPDWDYRLHHVQGSINQLIFTNMCSGTVGSVSGAAVDSGWTVTNYPDKVVFSTTNYMTEGEADTFTLSHPWCSDIVDWQVGDSSGSVDGPLPVELLSFTATPGDCRIALEWTTGSETDNDHFELKRNNTIVANIAASNLSTGDSYCWAETNLSNGRTYTYSLSSCDMNGTSEELALVSATPFAAAATVTEHALYQNHPNPFNPWTSITFDLAESGFVNLKVYNMLGQQVAVLVNHSMESGRHSVTFDAAGLPSGLYLYRMETGDFSAQKKMVLMK